ncbi:MAG: cyclic nucleotide-binding domain-containing protein [Deltaproteobacteria bacterium]|nr:cyclic nucleotide-binding domain-containing protein [Deltaproteobacteria bacterium]
MDDLIKRAEVAKKNYIFQDLDPEELETVARIMVPTVFPAQQTIMKEGDFGQSMYLMASGSVQVYKALTMKFGEDDFRETEKTLNVLKAEQGVVFGEMAMVTESERSATITTLTECQLYKISRDDYLTLCHQMPTLGFKSTRRIAELVSERLKKSSEDIIRLTTALSIALSP